MPNNSNSEEELARLEKLRSLNLLDTRSDSSFDRLTSLASRILKTPISLVSLVDKDCQFFKSQLGLPAPWSLTREIPLSHSFSKYMILTSEPLIIEDTRIHPVVKENLAIQDFNAIAYAGIPLITSDGFVLGSFCVIDRQPRRWTDDEIHILKDLALSVMTEIELQNELKERELMAIALERREAQYRQILDAIQDFVLVKGEKSKIIWANKSFREYYGMNNEDLQGAIDAPFAEPDYTQQYIKDDEQVFLSGEVLEIPEEPVVRHDGVTRFFHTFKTPIFDEEGQVVMTVGVSRDITARKLIEDQSHAAYAKQLELNELKARLVSMISHEFRTPLAVIRSSVELLQRYYDRMDDAKRLAHYNKTFLQINRLTTMIDDMLTLGKAETISLIDGNTEVIEFASFCQEIADEIQQTTEDHIIEFNDTHLHKRIEVNTDLMRQVINNLLSNAVKYSPEGGVIHFDLIEDEEREQIQLKIRDSGVGIPANELERLFDTFFRATNVGSITGTGLGLAIAKQAVELHGGTIHVQSQVNVGTTFTVAIPTALNSDIA